MTTSTAPRSAVVRPAAVAGVIGGVATALSGLVVQFVVAPHTTVSPELFSYPLTPGQLVPVSLVYAVLHLLVAAGVVAFARSGLAGSGRGVRVAIGLAIAGPVLLAAAELASIAIREATTQDTAAAVVGSLFGAGTAVGAVGLLVAGFLTVRHGAWSGWGRWTPLTVGIVTLALLGLIMTPLMAVTIAVYGGAVAVFGVAVATATPNPTPSRPAPSTIPV